jgi:hypothetical protein
LRRSISSSPSDVILGDRFAAGISRTEGLAIFAFRWMSRWESADLLTPVAVSHCFVRSDMPWLRNYDPLGWALA